MFSRWRRLFRYSTLTGLAEASASPSHTGSPDRQQDVPSPAVAFRRGLRPAVLQTRSSFSEMPRPPSAAQVSFHLTGKSLSQPFTYDNIKHLSFNRQYAIQIRGFSGGMKIKCSPNQGCSSLPCRQKCGVLLFCCSTIRAGSYPISTLLLPVSLRNSKAAFPLLAIHCSLNEKDKKITLLTLGMA